MQQNDVLNQVLVVMGRSLLQYSADCWPWTADSSAISRAAVETLMTEQSGRVRRLAEFLDDRGWTIDFGVFPDFTGLHFLSLDYVLPNLVENERGVVKEFENAIPRCTGDAQGAALLVEFLGNERTALARLEDLARAKSAAAAPNAA
jgi:hypothetical protein